MKDNEILDEIETILNTHLDAMYNKGLDDPSKNSLANLYMGMIFGTLMKRDKG